MSNCARTTVCAVPKMSRCVCVCVLRACLCVYLARVSVCVSWFVSLCVLCVRRGRHMVLRYLRPTRHTATLTIPACSEKHVFPEMCNVARELMRDSAVYKPCVTS